MDGGMFCYSTVAAFALPQSWYSQVMLFMQNGVRKF
jgi:hypothetical protein